MTVKFNFPRRSLLACAAVAALLPGLAAAKCADIPGKGEINIVGSSMPSVQHLAKEMESCSKGALKVSIKITPESKTCLSSLSIVICIFSRVDTFDDASLV